MHNNNTTLLVSILLSLSLTACGGSSSEDNSNNEPQPINSLPQVDAGDDISVSAGELVTLNVDVIDDDEVSYNWQQLSGESVDFTGENSQSISFTAPSFESDTNLAFEVTVNDGVNASVSDSISVLVLADASLAPEPEPEPEPELSHWIVNNTTTSQYIHTGYGSVLEDVQLAELVSIEDRDYQYVESTGIPKYDVTISQAQIDELNYRPRANNDFRAGTTTAIAGEQISFGEDIGYNSSNENCPTTGGDGYWPPGPGCPTMQNKQAYFPAEPVNTEESCETGLGKIGLMVNGTSIYNWGDGQSYGQNLWYNLAPVAEQYDVDICGGHAANGDYHHHFYTSCFATLVGDDGSAHSPLYGFAADGYPIYGPYEDANTLALSGWKVRDYSADTAAGGCNSDGKRSCILVDQYDLSKGVESVTAGPDIGELVQTLSGNTLAADAGYYFEDYYYAGESATGAMLDQHNGHDIGDGKGYHYHITLTVNNAGKLIPAFPYTVGPRFKGELADNSITQCSGNMQPPPRG